MKPLTIESHSKCYKVSAEYETAFLYFRKNHPLLKRIGFRKKYIHYHNSSIAIGDFYGDCLSVLISADESFVAMCGSDSCIVYFLNEPFDEFSYDIKSALFASFDIGGNKVYQSKKDKAHFFRLSDDSKNYLINTKNLSFKEC